MEIELKLACSSKALNIFESKVLPTINSLAGTIARSQAQLYNEYFDTPDNFFSERKMGLRLRSNGQTYEQTIKTRGKVAGGLHQRPEYNVTLASKQIDLSLFDKDIWDENTNVPLLNTELESLFSTDFERTTFEYSDDTSKVEIVFDFGEVRRGQESIPISEIELELIDGHPSALFELASIMIEHIPCQLSNQTKAARGYHLINSTLLESKSLAPYLKLSTDDSTENAFCKFVEKGLSHWQHHQQVYAQTSRLKALTQIRESIDLLLQGIALYLPILQCDTLLELHKNLLKLSQRWVWQKQLQSIHQLRSKKGPFSRRIPKNQNVMNYLMGRREGLLNAHKPHKINHSYLSVGAQLSLSRLLLDKPWRENGLSYKAPINQHANAWLSQTWQTVQQTLPDTDSMDDKQYIALEAVLKQSLINGFLVSDLFSEARIAFRAPWLDLASGIDELRALKLLYDAMDDLALEDKADYCCWIEDKTHSVIKVMEQTRKVAMSAETYW